jgi:hypothetical protein
MVTNDMISTSVKKNDDVKHSNFSNMDQNVASPNKVGSKLLLSMCNFAPNNFITH